MYDIIFYHSRDGKSDIEDFLQELNKKSKSSKTDRINYNKILLYLNSLRTYGTRIGMPIVRHMEGNLWEIRPLDNRIFFFYWKDNKFVLLHHYMKKTNKTPPLELQQARLKLKDFLERSGE